LSVDVFCVYENEDCGNETRKLGFEYSSTITQIDHGLNPKVIL
jgi:hypothetical protein